MPGGVFYKLRQGINFVFLSNFSLWFHQRSDCLLPGKIILFFVAQLCLCEVPGTSLAAIPQGISVSWIGTILSFFHSMLHRKEVTPKAWGRPMFCGE